MKSSPTQAAKKAKKPPQALPLPVGSLARPPYGRLALRMLKIADSRVQQGEETLKRLCSFPARRGALLGSEHGCTRWRFCERAAILGVSIPYTGELGLGGFRVRQGYYPSQYLPGESHRKGIWRIQSCGHQRVGHDLETKQQQETVPDKHSGSAWRGQNGSPPPR